MFLFWIGFTAGVVVSLVGTAVYCIYTMQCPNRYNADDDIGV